MNANATAARTGRSRLLTQGGYFVVPNSVAENLYRFAPAEVSMLMIVLRRSDKKQSMVDISSENWERWTRLGERMRQHAIAGLKKKGLVTMQGKGDKAKFGFDPDGFERYIETEVKADEKRARTEGRTKAVPAPDGMKVHEACRSKGCQQLCDAGPTPACAPAPVNKLVELPVTRPVAPARKRPARLPSSLPLTFAYISAKFPTTTESWCIDLFKTCMDAGVLDLTDELLVAGVDRAFEAKRKVQQAEGMFIRTVPPVLLVLQRERLAEKERQDKAYSDMRTASAAWLATIEAILQTHKNIDLRDVVLEARGLIAIKTEADAGRLSQLDAEVISRAAAALAGKLPALRPGEGAWAVELDVRRMLGLPFVFGGSA